MIFVLIPTLSGGTHIRPSDGLFFYVMPIDNPSNVMLGGDAFIVDNIDNLKMRPDINHTDKLRFEYAEKRIKNTNI